MEEILSEKSLINASSIETEKISKDSVEEYFNFLKASYPEIQATDLQELLKSENGWKIVKGGFESNNFPEGFDTSGEYPDEEVDFYQDFKVKLIPLMFEYNPEKARVFFKNHLLTLYKKRRQEWINRQMWADHSEHEPDDFENEEATMREYTKSLADDKDGLENFNSHQADELYDKSIDSEIDQENFEIFGKITTTILNEFSKHGTKEIILSLINFIENDWYCRFHIKELADCFSKIDKDYSVDLLVTMLGSDYVRERTLEKSKIMLVLLLEIGGVEEARKAIIEQIEKYDQKSSIAFPIMQKRFINPDLQNALDKLRSLITPFSDKTTITNLQSFYQENIKFEEYDVNRKMNEKEVALLSDLISKDSHVLEMGCGTGRLLLEMSRAGRDVVGIDLTPRHIDLIREQNPQAKAFVADWHDSKIQGEEFDAVYSLGRNILHDYSFIDQVATFREAHRLLKVGGKFIFDIPNREKGGYKEMVDGYAEEMKKRGIKNFRFGSIYDSPDGQHFATRYAFSHEDIQTLAQLTGFEIIEVKKQPLETGKDDENLYYVIEKKI